MAINNSFARLKREIGIKRCVIIDGNIGDVYLDEKGNIVDLTAYLRHILKELDYDNIVCWDMADGTGDNTGVSDIVDRTAPEGEQYFSDEEYDSIISENDYTETNDIKDILSIVMKSLLNRDKRAAFILNWADYMFSGSQTVSDQAEREALVILGKAIRERLPSYTSADINESTVIMITNRLSMIPAAFYRGNPEVSVVTLPKPDREEREAMMAKLGSCFEVKTENGKPLMEYNKINEYIDMLGDLTNREMIQLARLSRKEERMSLDKLYLLFRYGEKDNPWEKLAYSEVARIKERLAERVIGQDAAIEKLEKVVIKAYMGMTGMYKTYGRSMPKGVLFFVGPTGVGKTELSKALAGFLFGDDSACIRFDMSEYAQENSDQKLIGAPPGYVGYEEGGQLTNAIKKKPFSVILFDEIEKAAKPNPRILDIFLQILEDGRLTDSKGETVYFSESVIIFTSNLGAGEVGPDDEDAPRKFFDIVKDYFDKEVKRPELLGRIGYSNIVPFNFINDAGLREKLALSKLEPIKKGIAEKYRMNLTFADEHEFVRYIIGKVDGKKGGRDILNAINDCLLDGLAMFLFKNKKDLKDLRGCDICAETGSDGISFKFK